MRTTLVAGAVALAVAAPVGYNLHKTSQESLRLIHTEIANEQRLQRAEADVAAMRRQLEEHGKRLPSEPSASWVVEEAAAQGERSGLQLSTIVQESPQEFPQFTRLAVTFEFTASYHQLGAFLDRIEHSERFIRVERLEVVPEKTAGGEAAIRLTLGTIYLPPRAAAPMRAEG